MKNIGLSKFVGFIRNYGDEAAMIANALRIVATPFLDAGERRAIDEIINRFEGAAENIAAAIPELEKVSTIRIDKNDIKTALKELLPDIIAGVLEQQSRDVIKKGNAS